MPRSKRIVQHPILFLDLDGVLNGLDRDRRASIHPECVEHFNRLLDVSRAQVVISSTWRGMVETGAMNFEGFGLLLSTHGIRSCEVIGVTPGDDVVERRGAQIDHWCKKNAVTRYVVLDDMDDGITQYRHPFVRTNGSIGMTGENVDQALSLLESQMVKVANSSRSQARPKSNV